MDAGSFPSSAESPRYWIRRLAAGFRVAVARCGWLLCGLLWTCIAANLCGCGSMNGWVMNRSGQAYYKRGNYVAARHEFNRALKDSPRNAHYAYNLGQTLEKQGDVAGAEQMYQQALTLNPEHRPSYRGLSNLLTAQGRGSEARELLTAWTATQPYSHAAHVELADVERREGDIASAQVHMAQALSMKPRSPAALRQMGQLQQEMGNHQAAAAYYQRSLAMNPFQPQVSAQLASMQGTGGQSGSMRFNNGAPRSMGNGTMQAMYGGGPQIANGSPMGDSMAYTQSMDTRMLNQASGATPWVTQDAAGQPLMAPQMVNSQMAGTPMVAPPQMNPQVTGSYSPTQPMIAGQPASGPMMNPAPGMQPPAIPGQTWSAMPYPAAGGMIPAGGQIVAVQGMDQGMIQPVELGQSVPMPQGVPGAMEAPQISSGPSVQAF